MVVFNVLLVITLVFLGTGLCAVAVAFGAIIVRQGGRGKWLAIVLWWGCPAWGFRMAWQEGGGIEPMLWLFAGLLVGAGVLLEWDRSAGGGWLRRLP